MGASEGDVTSLAVAHMIQPASNLMRHRLTREDSSAYQSSDADGNRPWFKRPTVRGGRTVTQLSECALGAGTQATSWISQRRWR